MSPFKTLLCSLVMHYYFSVGFLSYNYRIERHHITQSRWRHVYVNCINCLHLMSLPIAFMTTHDYLLTLGYVNEQLQRMDTANVLVSYVCLALIIVTRPRREVIYEKMASEFHAIRVRYMDHRRRHKDIDLLYDRLLLLGILIGMLQATITFYLMMFLSTELTWPLVCLTFFYINMVYILHGALFYYFVALCHAAKNFDYFNRNLFRLRQDLNDCRHMARGDVCQAILLEFVRELEAIISAHWRTTAIVHRLNRALPFQIIMTFMPNIMNYVMLGYYGVLAFDGYVLFPSGLLAQAVWLFSYLLPILNFIVFFRMCESVTRAYKTTAEILRHFQSLAKTPTGLDRQVELFALQMVQQRLRLNIGGIFTLNMSACLGIWVYILKHIFIVLQYDFADRYHRPKAP